MLNLGSNKIYLCAGHTDMRKSINGLSLLAEPLVPKQNWEGAVFVFRGKNASRIKLLWWDGQGFCLFYKRFERGKFIWPNASNGGPLIITRGQLSMLMEGIDWRAPTWSKPPEYAG